MAREIKLTISDREFEFLRFQAVIKHTSVTSYLKMLIGEKMKQKKHAD